jgi:hypothetical protein
VRIFISKRSKIMFIIFLSFFVAVCKNCYAAGEAEEQAKKSILDALNGMKNNNLEQFLRDFSPDLKASTSEAVIDYDSTKEYFSNIFARSLVTDIDNIRFLGVKISNNTAGVVVQFRVSFIDLTTKESKKETHNNFFFVEKVNDSWKVMNYTFQPPVDLEKQKQASAPKEVSPKEPAQAPQPKVSAPVSQSQPKPKAGNATASMAMPFSK